MTNRDADLSEASEAEAFGPPSAVSNEVHGNVVREDDLVPGWLALLVLVLLLAVVGVGGYVLRGVLMPDEVASPTRNAVEEWLATVDENPGDAQSHLSLGYAYQQDGEYESALKQYDAVLEQDAQNLAAMYNKGVVLLQLGQTQEAEETLWDVLEMAPDHALAAKTLGELYIDQKHYKSTLVAVDPVVEARPELADLQYLSGFANEQLGNAQIAIGRYRAALKYSPDLLEAKDGLNRLGAEE